MCVEIMRLPRSILLLALAFILTSGCAHQEFYQIPYSKIDSIWKPYDGMNFELDIFSFNVSQAENTTWGIGITQMNFFYKLALGIFVRGGVPALGEGTASTYGVVGGGLILEPPITQYLKLAIQAGPVAFIPSQAATSVGTDKRTVFPGMEYALGLFTAFHYRAGLDLYVAHTFDPELDDTPIIFAVRLHIIGFSYKAFSKDEKGGLRRLGDVPFR